MKEKIKNYLEETNLSFLLNDKVVIRCAYPELAILEVINGKYKVNVTVGLRYGVTNITKLSKIIDLLEINKFTLFREDEEIFKIEKNKKE